MSSITEGSNKLYYIRKTVIQMLNDRGYLVSNALKSETLEEFKQTFANEITRDKLTLLQRKKDDPTEQIFVFFPDDQKVGVKPIRGYCEKMKEIGVQKAIIVVQQQLTPFAKQALQEMAPKYKLEQFTENELLVNITEHSLVPRHIKLTVEEKKALLSR